MSRPRVNYDDVAPTYDDRYTRGSTLPELEAALRENLAGIGASRVLEVGCGTGHWIGTLAASLERAVGLDFSRGMLARAQGHTARVDWVQGAAESLPFANAAFDAAICVNALHHFRQPERFVGEAARLLIHGGLLAIVGMHPDDVREWVIYDYFPGTRLMDMARYPRWTTVKGWLREAGLVPGEVIPAQPIRREYRGREALDSPFIQKNGSSQLALLTDAAYAAGIARLEADIAAAEARGESITLRADLTLSLLVGAKPG